MESKKSADWKCRQDNGKFLESDLEISAEEHDYLQWVPIFSSGRVVAVAVCEAKTSKQYIKDEEKLPVIADRIVACINACAGIENPSALPEVLEAVRVLCKGHMRDSDDNIYALKCLFAKLKN